MMFIFEDKNRCNINNLLPVSYKIKAIRLFIDFILRLPERLTKGPRSLLELESRL